MTTEYECTVCGNKFTNDCFEDAICPHCGTVFETDWEYVNDGIVCWIVKEKEE
jgi:DNA-directed RNA polymerase subunit RPC12/RpoP